MIRHTKGLLSILLCLLLVICNLSSIEANNESKIINTPIGNLIKQEPPDNLLSKQAEYKEKVENDQTSAQIKKDTPNPVDYTFENRSDLKDYDTSIYNIENEIISSVESIDSLEETTASEEVIDANPTLNNSDNIIITENNSDNIIITDTDILNSNNDTEVNESASKSVYTPFLESDYIFTVGSDIDVWGYNSIVCEFDVDEGAYHFYLENASMNIGLSLVDSNNTLLGEDNQITGYDSYVRIDAELSAGTYYLIVYEYYDTEDDIYCTVITGETKVEIISPVDDDFCTDYINVTAFGTGIEMYNVYANDTLIWCDWEIDYLDYDYYPPSTGIYDIRVEGITYDGTVSVNSYITGVFFCKSIAVEETITIENSYENHYTFTINTPTGLTLKTEFLNANCDTQLSVYDSIDSLLYDEPLYENEDSNGTQYSNITEMFQPGTYYVTVRIWNCNYPACTFSLKSTPYLKIETPTTATWSRFENGVEITGYGSMLHHTELYVNDVLVPGSYNAGNVFNYLYSSSTPGEYTFKVIGYNTEFPTDPEATTITDTTTIVITDILTGNDTEHIYEAMSIDYQMNITTIGTYGIVTDYNLPFSIMDSSNNLVASSSYDTFNACETIYEILPVGTYQLVFNNNTATSHSFSFTVWRLENFTPDIFISSPTDDSIYNMLSDIDISYDVCDAYSLKVYMNNVLIDESIKNYAYFNSFTFMPPNYGEYTMRIEACNSKDNTIPGAQTVIEERKLYVAKGAEVGKTQIIDNKATAIYVFDLELSGVYRFKVESTSDVYIGIFNDLGSYSTSNADVNYINELEYSYNGPSCYVKVMSASHYENNDNTPFSGTLTVARSELDEDDYQVKAGNTDITINWPEQDNVTSYQIYRNNALIYTTTANISSYTDRDLPSGTQFKYKILTNDGNVYSDLPLLYFTAKTLSPVYEAESSHNIHSGATSNKLLSGKYGVNISNLKELTISNIYSDEELTYAINIYYLCSADQNANISVNGNTAIPISFPNTNNTVQCVTVNLELTKGFNDINIVNSDSSLTIDYVEIDGLYHVGGKAYEAESLSNTMSNTLLSSSDNASRRNIITVINENSSITFDGVKATESGKYVLYIYYAADANTQCVIKVNSQDTYSVDLPGTGGKIAVMYFPIQLNAGNNTIQFIGNSEQSFCLDKVFVPSGYIDTLAPLAPKNLSTTVNADNTVTICWDDAIDNAMISSYIVYKNYQPYATVTDNTYTDEHPGDGVNIYTVVAEDYNSNQSGNSKQTYSGDGVSERTLQTPINSNCYLLIKGSGLDNFGTKEFYVAYNPDEVEVIDPIWFNFGGLITVTYNEPGLLKYKLNTNLPANTTWAGISNVIKLFAKTSTASIFTYYK